MRTNIERIKQRITVAMIKLLGQTDVSTNVSQDKYYSN